jgi:GntR family transcriptional regulator/MocR family aminotransferase
MEPIFALDLSLPKKGSRALLRSLHGQLRAAIIEGRLQAGVRLPASRALAQSLSVSRNTVVLAYEMLVSEGYLVTNASAGTSVADVRPKQAKQKAVLDNGEPDHRLTRFWQNIGRPEIKDDNRPVRYDFRPGNPDMSQFPFEVWRRLTTRAARSESRRPIRNGEPQGSLALRQAIAGHVSYSRAVACSPDDIVVTSGFRHTVDMVARIMVVPGETQVALEDPCYQLVRRIFEAAGARIVSIPVDDEGLVIGKLPPTVKIICASPSHQFPLGVTMSPGRRAGLLEFANRHGAVIIEDDYDSEFRIEGRPLDALHTLDRQNVVFYAGTFSKCLFGALRIGFVVAPPWARKALIAAKQFSDSLSPILQEEILAAFINEGHLAKHIRKMRAIYSDRHDILLESLQRNCGSWLKPIPSFAGVHLAAVADQRCDIQEIAARALDAGIRLQTFSSTGAAETPKSGLAFGFGLIKTRDIKPAIAALAQCRQ